VLISGAAANIAFQSFADFLFRGIGVPIENLLGRHDHTRRTEPALQSVLVPEGFLDSMELPVGGQALDRKNVRAVGLNSEHGATFYGFAVDLYRARSAQRRFTPDVRASEAHDFAEIVNQQEPWLDCVGMTNPVNGQVYRLCHGGSIAQKGSHMKIPNCGLVR
jgi:hypothetical protein